jgi:hypothetical protein
MTLSALGIFSAAGAGGGPVADTSYELIESVILGAAQSTITFSSLGTYSSTYKHLQIRGLARFSDSGSNERGINLRLNADSGSNYAIHGLFGDGSSAGAYGVTGANQIPIGAFPTGQTTANVFAPLLVDFLDTYSTTKNKTVRSLSGFTGLNQISLRSGVWLNTASITSITLTHTSTSTDFVIGSRFSLYGIKG